MCPFCGKMYWCECIFVQSCAPAAPLCPKTLHAEPVSTKYVTAERERLCRRCIIITPVCCWLRSGVWANSDPWCCHSGAGWKYHLEPSALMHSRGLPPLCAHTRALIVCSLAHTWLLYTWNRYRSREEKTSDSELYHNNARRLGKKFV